MIYGDRDKLKRDIDMDELRSFMSRANVRGWIINPRGHTYVAFHEGQACLEELVCKDLEEQRKHGGATATIQGATVFLISMSMAVNIKKFLSELCRIAIHTDFKTKKAIGPVAEAAEDKDVKGHFGRLLDQVKLVKLQSGSTRRNVKQEAVRGEIRKLLRKCRNKYGLTQRQLVDIFEDEVKLMFVKDVMES